VSLMQRQSVAIFISLVLYVFMHSKSAYEGLKEEIV